MSGRNESLVEIFVGDDRCIPTDLLLMCLEFAGLVRVAHSSLYFWIRNSPVRVRGLRGRFPRLFR